VTWGFAQDMDDYLRTLVANNGSFLRSDVLALGLTDKDIARKLRSGTWHRIRRGTYTFPDQWEALDLREQHLARAHGVLASARTGVVLSHTSAALALGAAVWDMDQEMVHLTRLDGRAGRHETGVTQHQGWLGAGDVTIVDRRFVTDGTRTALDVTRISDVEHALVIVDGLLHARQTTIDHLHARAESMRHWPDSLNTDLVLRLADGRPESVGEIRTFFHCWAQHLPAPEPQFKVWNQGRIVARLDFAWPELGVWLEFDGKVKYLRGLREGESATDVVIREKKREDDLRRITGWICVRVTWADLYEPARLAARIREAFATYAESRRGWTPDFHAS